MRSPLFRMLAVPLLACLLALPNVAFGQEADDESDPTLGTLFEEDMMFTNKAFSASVRFAGLVDTLESEGPFTVFVFSNEAASTLEEEFPNPENDPGFQSLIEYHVVPGRKVMASDFPEVDQLQTLEGSPIEVETKGGTSVVVEGGESGQRASEQPETIVLHGKNSVEIGSDPTHRDLTTTSNGVIHIIDSVLRVPSE